VSLGVNAGSVISRCRLVCPNPTCSGRLDLVADASGEPALRCRACQDVFPIVNRQLPVLTPKPALTLARAALELRRAADRQRGRLAELAEAAQRLPGRRPVLEQIASGVLVNLEFLSGLLEEVTPYVVTRAVVEVAADLGTDEHQGYGPAKVFEYMRRDWSGAAETEAEVTALSAAIWRLLEGDRGVPRRVLFLGAGTGRLAEDIADKGCDVTAIDVSFPMLASAHRRRVAPIRLCEVRTVNVRTRSDHCRFYRAAPAPPRKGRKPVAYALADLRSPPFFGASFDAVVSAYTSDVAPLDELLPGVSRVLPPGGVFIHVGPFGHHFRDTAWHLCAADWIAELESRGYRTEHSEWLETTHLASAADLFTSRVQNLLFRGRKL
jgi:SAM-dependent methyltransferase/uncharacterized protein YbaR (Trm112 family)